MDLYGTFSAYICKFRDLYINRCWYISKESGLDTFRDNDGLWNNHRVEDVATPEAFTRNPSLVYNFYNNRRRELNNGTKPNKAHLELVELEKTLKINVITQNIDNLHEVAGNSSIIYIHGELNKARCIKNDTHISTTGQMI